MVYNASLQVFGPPVSHVYCTIHLPLCIKSLQQYFDSYDMYLTILFHCPHPLLNTHNNKSSNNNMIGLKFTPLPFSLIKIININVTIIIFQQYYHDITTLLHCFHMLPAMQNGNTSYRTTTTTTTTSCRGLVGQPTSRQIEIGGSISPGFLPIVIYAG